MGRILTVNGKDILSMQGLYCYLRGTYTTEMLLDELAKQTAILRNNDDEREARDTIFVIGYVLSKCYDDVYEIKNE